MPRDRSPVQSMALLVGVVFLLVGILGFIPGGSKIARYFDRYKSAQVQLDSITRALESGQDELRKDNASIEQEKVKPQPGPIPVTTGPEPAIQNRPAAAPSSTATTVGA